ncbi:glycoside hydrolase family 61 protein [Coprinellus micaceus]|uniref:lytic cellulose monooxygenase (C4-dehydrogenating) n=1 Tax=Coprinellus micaceus TaxID=71717 RepID=A0A4Y7TZC3_COPMI|nr:glycoside hydrolase family 61 protein [Coprinellus micaceus]
MPSLLSSASLAILSLVAYVAAHGYVQELTLGANLYTGYLPYYDPYHVPTPQRIVRRIPSNGPVEDLTSIDLQCHGWSEGGIVGSKPAPLVGTIAAGQTIHFNWTTWPDSHKGPLLTYMARVPAGTDITKWEPGTKAVWFKIDHVGKDQNGKWTAVDALTGPNTVYSVRIPPKLKPGQYLVRHEILALHGAFNYPGVQAYPSCTQIEVTGSGNALPVEGLVAFPGAYTPETPGIVYDIYTHPTNAYPIPGPKAWTGGN